jgi:hypothetical protein
VAEPFLVSVPLNGVHLVLNTRMPKDAWAWHGDGFGWRYLTAGEATYWRILREIVPKAGESQAGTVTRILELLAPST